MNIADKFEKIRVCINKYRLASVLKYMSRPVPPAVYVSGVAETDILKHGGLRFLKTL